MNKDTIYIDVEDDITVIIGKVKASKAKIVALVPPKRIGVLQSAVNLRLLARAAKQSNKHLVLISGNQALTALAASANIPSARTLQSKPELVALPHKDDDSGEDIIDGAELPVGDLADTESDSSAAETVAAATAVDSVIKANAVDAATKVPRQKVGGSAKRGIKVPNFDTFRKKLALGGAGLVLLIGFLVWAIWFAPNAHIVITARTIESSANPKITFSTDVTTDAEKGMLKAVRQEVSKEAALSFEATGSKEVGERAKGEVVFQNCEDDDPISVPAGTGVSAGGKTYITQAAATVPGAKGFASCAQPGQSSPVSIIAQDIGDDFNTDKGTRFSVAGHSNASSVFYFRATATTDIDGGSKKEITVVTQDDVQKATDQLNNQTIDGMKQQLADQFGDDVIVIDSTFSSNRDKVTSSPAVDEEAKEGKAQLSGTLLYTMYGVSTSEAKQFLDAFFAEEIKDEENQRVYNSGAEKANFMEVKQVEGGAYTATMTATATFGPKIDDEAVKAGARGKRYGEVQSELERISGVQDVDVKFSPFWVRTVPNDDNRITIEFKLDESE